MTSDPGTDPTASPTSPWRVAAFRRFWAAETVSAAGTGIGAVALPLIAVSVLQAPALFVGVLEAALWAPWLAFGLLAGVVVDRTRQRRLMIACDTVAAAAYATVPAAAVSGLLVPGGPGAGLLVAVAFVAGSVDVLSQTARQTYPPTILDAAQLATADSALQSAASATDVGAGPLAGVLTHLAGAVGGVAANGVSFLVSAVLLLFVRDGGRTPEPPGARAAVRRGTVRAEIAGGLRVLGADPWLRTSAVAAGLGNLVLTGVGSLQVLLLVRTVGVPGVWFGPLLLGEGVGGLLGAVLANRLAGRMGSCRAMVLLAVAGPVAGLLIVFTGPGATLAFFVVGSAGSTAAVVAGNVLSAVFRHRYLPARLRGRVTASTRVVAYAAAPLGALVAGASASAIGTRAAVGLLLVLGVLRGLLFLRRPWRTTRDLPTSMPGAVIARADRPSPRSGRVTSDRVG